MIVYDCKITNVEYGFCVEKREDGLYSLIYQKWDDGKSWNWNFPPSWAQVDNGAKIHLYKDAEDAIRDGNIFLIDNAACKIIELEEAYVVWYWNEEQSNVAKQPVDNLRIYNNHYQQIWSINEEFLCDEMCVNVREVDGNLVYVNTFSGCGLTIKVDEEMVVCVDNKLVK